MPQWIPTYIAAVRSGQIGADWTAERHEGAAACYETQAGGYTGRIGPDLLALAAEHRVVAERLRAAGDGEQTLFGSAA